jgi:Ca2+-binding EF-hand superfamily protein
MKRVLLTGLFVFLLTMPALAVENSDQVFNRFDADNDGQLSLEEFLKGDHSVSKGDDGTFSLSPVASGDVTENAELSAKHKRDLFERLDIDNNGAVNRKEWQDSLSTGLVVFRF